MALNKVSLVEMGLRDGLQNEKTVIDVAPGRAVIDADDEYGIGALGPAAPERRLSASDTGVDGPRSRGMDQDHR